MKPYTDADVQMLLRVLPIDHEDGTTLVEVVPGDPPRHIWGRPERVARAVLDALAHAGRLTKPAKGTTDAPCFHRSDAETEDDLLPPVHPDDRPRDAEAGCSEPDCILFDGHPLRHRAEDGRAWLDPGEPLNLGVRSYRRMSRPTNAEAHL